MSLDEFFQELRKKYLTSHPQSREDLSSLAHQFYNQGEYDKAAPFFEQILALDQYTMGPDHPNTATSLNKLAGLYREQGNYAKAEPLYMRALAIREQVLGPVHPDTATSLSNLASIHFYQSDLAKAEPLTKRALAIREKALGPEHPDTANTLIDLADIYLYRADFAKAEPLIQRALEITEMTLGPDHLSTTISLKSLALLYKILVDHDKAEPLYKRAIAIEEKAWGPDHPIIATSLYNLAELYVNQGDYAKAEPLHRRALAINEKSLGPDHISTASSLQNIAGIYVNQGDYAKAEPLIQRALAITEMSLGPDHPSTATSLHNLARLYSDQGYYAKAEPLIQRALGITEMSLGPDHPSTATSLQKIAKLYINQGDYANAEPLIQRALAITEKSLGPDHPDAATSLNNLALLYHYQGDHAKAEPLYMRALAISEKSLGLDHLSTATSLQNIAGLKIDQGDYPKAEPLIKRALAITANALGPAHANTATTLTNLAVLYRIQGSYAKAGRLFKRALAIYEKTLEPHHPHTVITLIHLSLLHLRQASLAKGCQHLNTAFRCEMRWLTREAPLLTSHRRIPFIRKILEKDNLPPTIAILHSEMSCFALWCRFNRYGLLQEIERRQLLFTRLSGIWADRVVTLRMLINQLASTTLKPDKRQQLKRDREEIEAELFRAFPQLVIPIVEVEDVAAALPLKGLLIEFQRFSQIKSLDSGENPSPRYVALLLTAGKTSHAVDLGPAQLLEQAIEDALQASAEELDDAAMLWMAVSEQLFTPLKKQMSCIEQCFLCPDAELHRVPFTALPSPWAPERLLAEVCQIHVIASARQLLTASESPVEGNRPLVVADPTFDQVAAPTSPAHGSMANKHRSRDMGSLENWGPLPATAVEGHHVAECLGGSLLLAEEASARNLQQTRHPRVLHVATHGYFLPDQDNVDLQTLDRAFLHDPSRDLLASFRGEDPMLRSGLVLAGANDPYSDPDDDGYLTALEATHLDLQGTELVTLSACDTGRGDIHTGEGVYGLQRALIVAGARSTLLSLWKVPDEATCDFMVRFYTRLKEGMGRSDALLTVQREFRQHENLAWRHHCYWAAWQLVGDWRPIQGL